MYEANNSEHINHERSVVYVYEILCEWSLILYGQNTCVFHYFPGKYYHSHEGISFTDHLTILVHLFITENNG